jgi:hypothetical protein
MKLKLLFFLCLGLNSTISFATDTTLKLQYIFDSSSHDSIADNSGNGYKAILMNGAAVKQIGRFNVLDLGSLNGYVDMTLKTGNLIKSLTGDFTVSTYVYVNSSVDLTAAGNFVWTFANSADMSSTANGNMFFTALNTRYAITTTNWSAELTVNKGSTLPQGSWQHVTYTQSGNTGTIYLNGIQVKTGTITSKPSVLGATTNNYIGRSCYSSDAYLLNSLLTDFRVYNRALSATEIVSLSSQKAGLDSAMIIQQVADAKTQLVLTGLNAVISNLTLPTDGGNSVVVSWSSSNQNFISNSGVVTRPVNGADTAVVVLTATLTKNGIVQTKMFTAKVVPYLSDRISVQQDSINLSISGNLNLLRSNLVLQTSGIQGSTITWNSDNPTVLSDAGVILNRPAKGTGNLNVTLTATITKGTVTLIKSFIVTVAEDEGFSGYLFAYFTGNTGDQESIRFALSDDAFVYTALNNDNPVLNSATISSSGGVRDPHILRGQNNDYYMVATDMVSALGWDSNRGLVLLKSTDMINWQSSDINIPKTYPEYSAADEVWAPQTIYDPTVGKYMIYFAMRLGPTDFAKIYYAYADSRFLGFESSPKLLFNNNGLSTIDPDIVLKDGVYNLFFKTEGNGDGIKKALSTNLTSGYVLYDKYLECTTNPVEGSCAFRLINSDSWILMYDEYTSGSYQLTTSTDLINFTVVTNPVSFDFTPRHGTVMPITAAEKTALIHKWNPTQEVENVSASKDISIYPNPVKGNLYFSISSSEPNIIISVLDLNGKVLIHQSFSKNKGQMDVSGLSAGIYLFQCAASDGTLKYEKFIVQ